ncbi:MAG: hypothetical protein AB7P52_17855 [Alphaproteobacteria bacterium]
MPFLIPAAIAGVAAGIGAGIAGATLAASLAIGAIAAGVNIVSSLLAPKPKKASFDLAAFQRDVSVVVRSSAEPRRVVYGEARVAGPMVFADSTKANGFDQLHLVIPLMHGRADAIGQVYLNDALAWLKPNGSAMYRQHVSNDGGGDAEHGIGLYSIYRHLGDDDQAADAALMAANPKWTSEHRLRGIAYLYVRLRADISTWSSGIPNVAAVLRGRRVWDPRHEGVDIVSAAPGSPVLFTTDGAHGLEPGDRVFIRDHEHESMTIAKEYQVATVPSSTTFTLLGTDGETLAASNGAGSGGTVTKMVWSNNAALCVLDYLLAAFGYACDLDEIDEASFIAAANICDEMVPLSPSQDSFVNDAALNVLVRPGLKVPMRRGDAVELTTTGTLPTGLSTGTTYYYIPEPPEVSVTPPSAGQPAKFRFNLASSRAAALAGAGIAVSGAGSGTHTVVRKAQVRYDCNGAISLDRSPNEVMRQLLSAMAGGLSYWKGAFHVRAGAYEAPTLPAPIDVSCLRGPISMPSRALVRRDLFNMVRGTFVNPDDAWQPADFPAYQSAAFKAADGGEEIARDIELAFTDDATRAQRLAKIDLMRARTGGLAMAVPCNMRAYRVAPLETVPLTLEHFGFEAAHFQCVHWRFTEGFGIDLSLSAVAAADFAWDPAEALDLDAPERLTPIDFTFVAAPGLALDDDVIESSAGEIVTRLIALLNPPDDQFITGYQAEFRKAGETEWTQMSAGARTRFYAVGVEDGVTYQVQARAINAAGAESEYALASREIVGSVALPADVTGFVVNVIDGTAHLSWNANAEIDLSHYRVRWSPATVSAAWESAIDVVPKVGRPATSVHLPALTGTYLIKAVDLGGRESLAAATSVTGIAHVLGFNAVETVSEHPDFGGTHDGTVVDENDFLTLESDLEWDQIDEEWDDIVGEWNELVQVAPSGTYTFEDSIDLGAVYTSRVTAMIAVTTVNFSDTWDTLAGNWDAIAGNWDSLSPAGNVGARLELRTTDDDPAGSPTWSAWRPFVVGDYTARAFECRVVLTSMSPDVAPGVSTLSVTVDMPDRIAAGGGTTSVTAAVTVTFSPAFKATPKVGVTVKDGASGDRVEITAEAASGFDISVYNSGGSRVVRNFDWMAKGYGEAA